MINRRRREALSMSTKSKNYKGVVAICSAGFHHVNIPEIIGTLSEYLASIGFRVYIYNIYDDYSYYSDSVRGQEKLFDKMNFDYIDLFIVLSESMLNEDASKKLAKRLRMARKPIINIGGHLKGCFNINMDHAHAFRQIVEHVVIHHGCRNVYLMAGFDKNSFSEKRIEIYKEVLTENGIEVDEGKIAHGDFWEIPARRECNRWLDSGKALPDAIVCCNDIMAITVCECLNERNISVPEDVIVTGFDRINLGRYTIPRLTTAFNDYESLSEVIGKLADDILSDNEIEPYDENIPHKMYVSDSCGCRTAAVDSKELYNKNIMKMYDKYRKRENNLERVFTSISKLVDADSVVQMLEGLGDVLFSDRNSAIINSQFSIIANKNYCNQTDIPSPKDWDGYDSMRIFSMKDSEASLPMQLVDIDIESQMIEEYAEDGNQVLFLPFNWQNEDYGYIIMKHDKNSLDYIEIYEYMMCLMEVFGIVLKKSQLHDLIIKDSLTHLLNRRGFFGEVGKIMKKNMTKHKIIFIASIDMDNLKEINDKYGHSEGDFALWAVGSSITECVGDEGICARFGGDEFLIAFISDGDKFDYDYYYEKVEKIHLNIEKYKYEESKNYDIDISIGYAFGEGEKTADIDVIMKRADDEMYGIKALHHKNKSHIRENIR